MSRDLSSSSRDDGRVTIADVAAALGLSKSSVSAALSGGKGVSEQTRQRVRAAADDLGWRPHAGARALRLQRSMAVGLVLARNPADLGGEPFYSLVIAGIEQVLQDRGYLLMLRMVGPGDADQPVYQRLSEERIVDGVILFDVQEQDARIPFLKSLALPFVMVGEVVDADILQVLSDGRGEAALLVDHLVGLGHRRLAYVSGPLSFRHERIRADALVQEARSHGAEVVISQSDYTLEGSAAAADELFAAEDVPSAIIGASDVTALGVIRAARQRGAAIPRDLSVASWDDSILGQVVTPQLTCLARDPMGIGRAAAALLLDHLADQGSSRSSSAPPAHLVVRASTAPPAITVW